MSTKRNIVAFVAGLIFAFGLALSGMTLPSKILAFFDFSAGLDSWDPSLAFVMVGAMLIYVPVYRVVRSREKPLWDATYRISERRDIDARLIGGSMLFGIGWGLVGLCPGPALASLGAVSFEARSFDALVFVVAMIVGMGIYQALARRSASE